MIGAGWGRRAIAAALVLALGAGVAAGASTRAGHFPVLVVGAGPSADYVLVAEGCPQVSCLVLDRFDPQRGRFTRVTRPPLTAVRDSPSGDLGRLVFASARLGVALVGPNGGPQAVYATRDGARRWRRVPLGAGERAIDVAAGGGALYVVTGHCREVSGFERCRDYRLAHTSGGAGWSSVPVPTSVTVDPFPTSTGPQLGPVAVFGPHVTIAQISVGYATPVRASGNAGRTWTTWRIHWPTLTSVDGCVLTPASATAIWAYCPTGMQVSLYRSGDGGRAWAAVHQQPLSGTGGGFFAPASPTTAYLDYGYPRHVLYAVRAPGLRPIRVGPLPCASITSETFSDVSSGAVVCTGSSSPAAAPRLVVTQDQGLHWRVIAIP
ncbi:MAG: hypothetical protein ACYCRG_06465 [Acidimicrobiales bacterium]